MTEENKLTKEEKFEKAIEWLENASYNCENVIKMKNVALVPMVKSQIENAIKFLRNEEVDKDVWGGNKK